MLTYLSNYYASNKGICAWIMPDHSEHDGRVDLIRQTWCLQRQGIWTCNQWYDWPRIKFLIYTFLDSAFFPDLIDLLGCTWEQENCCGGKHRITFWQHLNLTTNHVHRGFNNFWRCKNNILLYLFKTIFKVDMQCCLFQQTLMEVVCVE